jgi:hypothetical protein
MFNKNETMERKICHLRIKVFSSFILIYRFLQVSHIFQKNLNAKQIQQCLKVPEPQCSGFCRFIITYFNTVISTFCDQFEWSSMRENSWRVSCFLSYCYWADHSQFSHIMFFIEVNWFHTLCGDTPLQSSRLFYTSKNCLYFIKNKLSMLF